MRVQKMGVCLVLVTILLLFAECPRWAKVDTHKYPKHTSRIIWFEYSFLSINIFLEILTALAHILNLVLLWASLGCHMSPFRAVLGSLRSDGVGPAIYFFLPTRDNIMSGKIIASRILTKKRIKLYMRTKNGCLLRLDCPSFFYLQNVHKKQESTSMSAHNIGVISFGIHVVSSQ